MQNVQPQNKPADLGAPSLMVNAGDQAALSPELEKALGEAINSMLDPKLANMTGELSEREKILLQGLYMKAESWPAGANKTNYARLYAYDRIQKSVLTDRKRALEMVDILKEIQMYKGSKGILSRIKSRLIGD
jgi:hypothetical protein